MAAALLASRPAEEIAAALARVFRSRLPEPEEIDPLPLDEMRPSGKQRPDRPSGVSPQFRWFELNVGRQDRAEPKGILRMLTRSGGVERRHIGGIQIHDRTCHVEIAIEAADRFQKRTANPAPDEIRVRPIDEPGAKPKREFGSKPPRDKSSKPIFRDERPKSMPEQARKPHPKHKGKK